MDPPIHSPSLPLSQSLSSFTLSSSTSPLPTPLPSSLVPPTSLPQPATRPYTPFERLPPELIELIAYSLCRSTSTVGPPQGLVQLLLVSKRFEGVLSFKRNKGFYSGLFKERFDQKSIERRWNIVRVLSLSFSLLTLEVGADRKRVYQMRNIEEKREKLHLLQTLPDTKPSGEIHLNPSSSFTRPSSPSSHSLDDDRHEHEYDKPSLSPTLDSPWCPLTNRDYAFELKRRCSILTQMRRSVKEGGFFEKGGIGSSRPASPRSISFTPRRGTSRLFEPDELTQCLWTTYLMLLENGMSLLY